MFLNCSPERPGVHLNICSFQLLAQHLTSMLTKREIHPSRESQVPAWYLKRTRLKLVLDALESNKVLHDGDARWGWRQKCVVPDLVIYEKSLYVEMF